MESFESKLNSDSRDALKVAALSPSLKKPDADFKQFSNFRPISNLTLISKIIEKAVAEQLTDHVKTYHLDAMYQSAFKALHSTEMALLKVQNDILCAVDDNSFYSTCPQPLIRLTIRYCYLDSPIALV